MPRTSCVVPRPQTRFGKGARRARLILLSLLSPLTNTTHTRNSRVLT
jgi:hypothetical protein